MIFLRDVVDGDELATLKEIAAGWLKADAERVQCALQEGILQEIPYDGEK